ncbi:MAG: DUF3794 domain-containing protein [Marinisporobacter sp.]|jgi:hypothetical protein|nr:DUF3794 domain-containing protein [Marinisporobacter sp.]
MSSQCNDIVMERKLGSIACGSLGLFDKRPDEGCGCEEDQLIDIRGVCTREQIEAITIGASPDDTWTQIFIPEVLCIPKQKPDVEQILTLNSCIDIISQRVVKTPEVESSGVLVPNYEGTFSTGRKLIIEGILRQKIIYTADVDEQSVHSAHFDVPFSAFIVLPQDAPLFTKYKIEPCIEDIFICRVSKRQIFKNVTIFIKATPLTCA